MCKQVNKSVKARFFQTIEISSSETLGKNTYQLKNHLKRSQQKHSGIPSQRTLWRVQPFNRVDKERGAETECQPWEDISQDELQTALKKTSNRKSPGSDVVLNFWLKQLTTLHQNLNVYNQAVETPKICLIGSQQHKHTNYQRTKTQRTPKTLDQLPVHQHPLIFSHRFLAKRSYTHVTKNDILPTEQRVCVWRTYGCKDHLLMNKWSQKTAKRRKRT